MTDITGSAQNFRAAVKQNRGRKVEWKELVSSEGDVENPQHELHFVNVV